MSRNLTTWQELADAIFNPTNGLMYRHFPGAAERNEFRRSDEYEKLHSLVDEKMISEWSSGGEVALQ